MIPPTTWHPGDDLLQAYVEGGLPGLSAGSLEAHLLACAGCRETVRDGVDAARLARVGAELEDRLDQLSRPRLERFVTRLRLDEADVRALLAAPSLRRAWCLAIMSALALALVLVGESPTSPLAFLVLAPLVPLVATAVAYAPALDEAFALVSATPYPTARLLLARSLAVGITALLGVGMASILLPGRHVAEVVWLLPSTALTLLVLALAPALGTGRAAAGVAAGWLLAMALLERRGADLDLLAGAGVQALAAAVTAVALAAVVGQWRSIRVEGVQ